MTQDQPLPEGRLWRRDLADAISPSRDRNEQRILCWAATFKRNNRTAQEKSMRMPWMIWRSLREVCWAVCRVVDGALTRIFQV